MINEDEYKEMLGRGSFPKDLPKEDTGMCGKQPLDPVKIMEDI